jgi:glycosyltransferase involved in cell wall biosynthesis
LNESTIRVVPNAIETEKLVADEFQRTIPTDRPISIVAAGRLSFEKGYDILVRAIAIIKNQTPPFVVSVYGEGPQLGELVETATSLGVADRILFKGFADNMLPVFRESDFMVLPSRSEGMPNVILEAWSQKLGVVSAAVGGVPEMIVHGVGGLLAEPDNSESLAEQLCRAINNRDEMIRFGEVGYQLVQTRYSYQKQSKLLGQLYRDVVNRKA